MIATVNLFKLGCRIWTSKFSGFQISYIAYQLGKYQALHLPNLAKLTTGGEGLVEVAGCGGVTTIMANP